MKCPLFTMLDTRAQLDEEVATGECIRGNCAWWSGEHKQCDPTGLLPWLMHVESRLSDLVAKMPQLNRPVG